MIRLIIGGARSGKSTHAEALARRAAGPVWYVATAPAYPDDPEWAARVAVHRARRPDSWNVIETSDIARAVWDQGPGQTVVVDCITLWLTAVIDDVGWDDAAAAERAGEAALTRLVAALEACPAEVILVSNEVGSGVIPATASGRLFADRLGRTNMRLAAVADAVDLVVAGIVVPIKSPAEGGTP